tara:strand:- start:1126 stop:1374 length:249 start_codon:yes stop_codon:yes gene_type:complete
MELPKNLALILVHIQCIDDLLIDDKTIYRHEGKRINNEFKKYVRKICSKMEVSCTGAELELIDSLRGLHWKLDQEMIKEELI